MTNELYLNYLFEYTYNIHREIWLVCACMAALGINVNKKFIIIKKKKITVLTINATNTVCVYVIDFLDAVRDFRLLELMLQEFSEKYCALDVYGLKVLIT